MKSLWQSIVDLMCVAPEFSKDYDVEIIGPDTDELYWKCIFVYHLKPEENKGNHHCYVATFDENWNFVNMPIGWYWNGIFDNETHPQPLQTGSKNWPDECANIVLQGNFADGIRLLVIDELESDVVNKVSSTWADEGDGNTWGHHSFMVGFKKVVGNGEEPPMPSDVSELVNSIKMALADVKFDVTIVEDLVDELANLT